MAFAQSGEPTGVLIGPWVIEWALAVGAGGDV